MEDNSKQQAGADRNINDIVWNPGRTGLKVFNFSLVVFAVCAVLVSTKKNFVRIKNKTINKAGGQARFSSFASFGRGVAGATCKCAKCAVAVFFVLSLFTRYVSMKLFSLPCG